LSITALVTGTTLIGVGYPESAQAAWAGSKGSGGTEAVGDKALGGDDAQKGKQLFSDPKLGGCTYDKSCNSCHPGGKGLENAKDLENMTQKCIEKALGGNRWQQILRSWRIWLRT